MPLYASMVVTFLLIVLTSERTVGDSQIRLHVLGKIGSYLFLKASESFNGSSLLKSPAGAPSGR